MIDYERDTINTMRAGQDRHAALATFGTRWAMREAHGHLSDTQRRAVEQILSSRDQVTALEGVAGGVRLPPSRRSEKPLSERTTSSRV